MKNAIIPTFQPELSRAATLDDFRQVGQDTAALNVIYKNGSDYEVTIVNDRQHLSE